MKKYLNSKTFCLLLIMMLACALLLGGCGGEAQDEPADQPQAEEPHADETQADAEEPQEEQSDPEAVYDTVLENYRSVLSGDPQTFFDEADETTVKGTNYEMDMMYFRFHQDAFCARHDYNGDGINELVIALGDSTFKQVWAIYGTDGEKAIDLFADDPLTDRNNLYILPDGIFMVHGSGGATVGSYSLYSLKADGTGLEFIDKYEYDKEANGSMDHIGSTETLTSEEFKARYWDPGVPAADYGGLEFEVFMENPGDAITPEEAPTAESAFEEIRQGYEQCMSEGAKGDSPYLEYSAVRWTVENIDSCGAVAYALYDVNKDGTPEMIMGYPEWAAEATDNIYTPFEIYAFDGTSAVPLTKGFVKEFDYLSIAPDGMLWTHRGNGGDPIIETYSLPQGGSEVEYLGDLNIMEDDMPKQVDDLEYTSITDSVNITEN